MKISPLQLERPEYPEVSVRANPRVDEKLVDEPLPIKVEAGVSFEADGRHFVYISIRQEDENFPYVVRLNAFSIFTFDPEGCRAAYKSAFNPGVIGANVARMLFSGARELLAFVTSRAPWGSASLPSLMIEPSDVELQFEDGKLPEILENHFGFTKERIQELRNAAETAVAHQNAGEASQQTKTNKRKKRIVTGSKSDA